MIENKEKCPTCGWPWHVIEKRPNGYSFCEYGHKWKTGSTLKIEDNQKHIERLEIRICELLKERDQYDKQRRAAMEKVEEYRAKYQELLKGINNE